MCDRPMAPWKLNVRLPQAEAMEALLHGCMTEAPRRDHHTLLNTARYIVRGSFWENCGERNHRLRVRFMVHQPIRGAVGNT